jgi:hypothetical protein
LKLDRRQRDNDIGGHGGGWRWCAREQSVLPFPPAGWGRQRRFHHRMRSTRDSVAVGFILVGGVIFFGVAPGLAREFVIAEQQQQEQSQSSSQPAALEEMERARVASAEGG